MTVCNFEAVDNKPACPACRSSAAQPVSANEIAFTWHESRINYSMLRCTSCGSFWAIPLIPAPSDYYDYPVPEWRWEFGELKHDLAKLFPDGAQVLEIGCNEGNCLAQLDGVKNSLIGIDFNQQAVEKGRSRGLDIRSSTIEELHNNPETPRFDLVFFFHVLEHVPDPEALIRSARRLIKPNGLIALSVPHPDRLRVLAAREDDDYPPNHLIRFSLTGLETLLNRTGLEIMRSVPQPLDLTLVEFASFRVFHLLRRSFLRVLYRKSCPRLFRVLGKLPFFVAAVPWAVLTYYRNRRRPGLAIYILARRQEF